MLPWILGSDHPNGTLQPLLYDHNAWHMNKFDRGADNNKFVYCTWSGIQKCQCTRHVASLSHVNGPSILIIFILFWRFLIRYLFRSACQFMSYCFSFPFSGLAYTQPSASSWPYCCRWLQIIPAKAEPVVLLICELLRKKHLSTVINNNVEPPTFNAFGSSTSIMTRWRFWKPFYFFSFWKLNVSWSLCEVAPLTF